MKQLSSIQLKSLADFANTVAAAWFTTGIISPIFTKPKSPAEFLMLLLVSLFMTGLILRWSLYILEGIKK